MRERLTQGKRWVVKIGSTLLTADGKGLDHQLIEQWSAQMATLASAGKEIVLVSSGSIAEGMTRLGWQKKPSAVHELQAAAAVGQMGLVQAYESVFKKFDRQTAQVLLTHEDMADRRRYLNARATLNTLLNLGVVPIINENDTVITDEIRLGDNDTLAAMVASLIEADVLVLLTDQDGLYNKDPRTNNDAKLLSHANASDPDIHALAGPSGSSFGSGGMNTKIKAAERAAKSGTTTVIASGREPDVLLKLNEAAHLGTMLTTSQGAEVARKRWLSNQLRVSGTLTLDAGAVKTLHERGASLLSVGVSACSGDFKRGELVACVDEHNVEHARGLINYSAAESKQLLGQSSDKIKTLLGYEREPELIHRDNMVLTKR